MERLMRDSPRIESVWICHPLKEKARRTKINIAAITGCGHYPRILKFSFYGRPFTLHRINNALFIRDFRIIYIEVACRKPVYGGLYTIPGMQVRDLFMPGLHVYTMFSRKILTIWIVNIILRFLLCLIELIHIFLVERMLALNRRSSGRGSATCCYGCGRQNGGQRRSGGGCGHSSPCSYMNGKFRIGSESFNDLSNQLCDQKPEFPSGIGHIHRIVPRVRIMVPALRI